MELQQSWTNNQLLEFKDIGKLEVKDPLPVAGQTTLFRNVEIAVSLRYWNSFSRPPDMYFINFGTEYLSTGTEKFFTCLFQIKSTKTYVPVIIIST